MLMLMLLLNLKVATVAAIALSRRAQECFKCQGLATNLPIAKNHCATATTVCTTLTGTTTSALIRRKHALIAVRSQKNQNLYLKIPKKTDSDSHRLQPHSVLKKKSLKLVRRKPLKKQTKQSLDRIDYSRSLTHVDHLHA